jgi:perosamine synthetase
MRSQGVGVAEHYPAAIIDQPVMEKVDHELVDDCAVARRLCRTEVSLPIHPYLTPDEVSTVIDACNSWKF